VSPTTISYRGGAHVLNHDGEDDVFNGYDPESGETFNLGVDDEIEVPEHVAEQVAEAHPGCFEVDGKIAGKRPSKKANADDVDGDLREQLKSYSREELNAAATQLGVDAPEALQNKAAVVDAIVAAKNAAADE
jgi:hypothetical protein